MGLFYIHHRWLSFLRKGDHLKLLVAVFVLSMFVFRLGKAFLKQLSLWIVQMSQEWQISETAAFQFILMIFFLSMTATKLMISPAPLHFEPYRLWRVNKVALAVQYVILSHLKPANFFWLFAEGVMLVKAGAYGLNILSLFVALWLIQHYLNIVLHRNRVMKWTLVCFLTLTPAMGYFFGIEHAYWDFLNRFVPGFYVVALLGLFLAISSIVRNPSAYVTKQKLSTKLFRTEGLNLADPLFDLEFKLIWRNKGTRTNLIFGFLSIPLLFYYFGQAGVPAGVFFMAIITTGLVLLQHGIYTMSWEGNYFDLLVTRFKALEFMQFKFRFYFWVTTLGLLVSSFTLLIDTSHLLPLMAAYCYNIGFNCYVVLLGVLGNKKKLSLGQSIVFKSESMTANVITVSFMTMLLPMALLGLLSAILPGGLAYYGVIVISLLGLIGRDFILKIIAGRMDQKKYELSQAFHD